MALTMLEVDANTVEPLMAAFRHGDQQACSQLMEILYPELRRLAASQMKGERKDHSWQPTVLINELYLQLVKIKALSPDEQVHQNGRAAFFALSAQIMRRLLIHHARRLSSKVKKIGLMENLQIDATSAMAELEHLLDGLAAVKPVFRTVVEMKVFEGLTASEIAPRLGCSVVTVNRYWQFAKHWLRQELGENC